MKAQEKSSPNSTKTTNDMAVLVTRPAEQGQALCQLLQQAGVPA
ncbi:uroporphyrinogen-III synthase, partial [Vibrio vulnificus]